MIVACSNCSKRYLVDPRALGAPGRRVRCANCRHTWFQPAPEDSQPPIELPPLPETPPVMRSGDPQRRTQLPAVADVNPRSRWIRLGVIALIVLLVLFGLIRGRGGVMSVLPFTTRLYSMVGLGPVVPGAGLELRQITPSRAVDGGVPTLTISGQIANISSTPHVVPQLRVALRDTNDHELQSWIVSVTDQPLPPGAVVPFHSTVQNPPDGATGVIVSFAASDGGN
jgi:predicted Zn finger-like uncharacterized protein